MKAKNRLITIIVFLLIALLGCKKYEDGFRVFTVPAYKHRSSYYLDRTWNKKSMDFYFTTNDTWIWEDQYPGGSHGWSKVRGFSEGLHSQNSLRLGYRYNSPHMIVGLYAKVNGNQVSRYLDTLEMNCTYFCQLAREGNEYVLRINGKEVRCKAGNGKKWGYLCYPWIGGEYIVKHDWNVLIKEN